MAARLETATKQYGAAMLISDTMYKIFGYRVKALLRMIDKVILTGSLKPTGFGNWFILELYTFDLDVTNLCVVKAKKSQHAKLENYRERKTIEK